MGEGLQWHCNSALRVAYYGYANVDRCLVNGHRPPVGWKRKPKRGRQAVAA